MDIHAEKLILIEELVKTQDINIIKQIKNLFHKSNDDLAGYDLNGKEITRQQLIERIENADIRIESGMFITQQEIEKEAEDW
ncbi:hypothetical protein PBAC_07730 [Pedobacter glucosidilyticus]|nr:hypothetical protein [Pedobacter glucosidilyticus]KHJ38910.1 hypothetical protein PBAC_07730 [Pedobacter glucosidilyticus]